MARQRQHISDSAERRRLAGAAPLDLYDYARPFADCATRRCRHNPGAIMVTDDWPDFFPVTPAEVAIIEAHFGDLLDELFGSLP